MPKNPWASPHAVSELGDAWPTDAHNPPPETAAEARERFAGCDAVLRRAEAQGEQYMRDLPAVSEAERQRAIDTYSSDASLAREEQREVEKVREKHARRRR
jgi:hypothetical protein